MAVFEFSKEQMDYAELLVRCGEVSVAQAFHEERQETQQRIPSQTASPAQMPPPQAEPTYEYAEIEAANVGTRWGLFGTGSLVEYKFTARANGPRGSYVLGTAGSTKILWYEAQEQLDWLNQKLIADGWQPIERGVHWYSYSYRRQL